MIRILPKQQAFDVWDELVGFYLDDIPIVIITGKRHVVDLHDVVGDYLRPAGFSGSEIDLGVCLSCDWSSKPFCEKRKSKWLVILFVLICRPVRYA